MKRKIFALPIFVLFLFLNSCTKKNDVPVPIVQPVVTPTPVNQTIESGTVTAIALTGSITGTTFSWTVVQSGVSGASSGSGCNINQTLSATGSNAGTATYSVTPASNGTSGNVVSVIVTVNPTVVASKVTYTADIKPLLTTSCAPCHVAGGNKAKWDNYATTKSKISGIIDRVQRGTTASGFMPQGGSKLSGDNIALLKKWVADGLLEN